MALGSKQGVAKKLLEIKPIQTPHLVEGFASPGDLMTLTTARPLSSFRKHTSDLAVHRSLVSLVKGKEGDVLVAASLTDGVTCNYSFKNNISSLFLSTLEKGSIDIYVIISVVSLIKLN